MNKFTPQSIASKLISLAVLTLPLAFLIVKTSL
jgi:hypothetical protein